jgi:hypothetical protein
MEKRRPHGTPEDGKAQLKRAAVALFVERMYVADRNRFVLTVETPSSYSRFKTPSTRCAQLQKDGEGENKCRRCRECTEKLAGAPKCKKSRVEVVLGYHEGKLLLLSN